MEHLIANSAISRNVKTIVQSAIEDMGFEIVRIKYNEKDSRTLQIMVDKNNNGVLDAGEDTDGNGALTRYLFPTPPDNPRVRVQLEAGKVTLYWDKTAERSRDRVSGEQDFEGYRIYRSTDAGFIDAYTITDAYGNITFKEPLAIFDLQNGLMGPHPIGYNGVQFDMGEDKGLQYIYVDSNNVVNGQTYYYAVTAFDKGYDLDFFENGFTPNDNLQPIAPSECSVTLDLDYKGNVVSLSENAAVVLPNPTSLGYIPPNTVSDGEHFITHLSGYGSGQVKVEVVDPFAIIDGEEYQVVFDTLETAEDLVFSVRNQEFIIETLTINPDSSAIASYDNIDDKGSVDVTNAAGTITYNYDVDYELYPEMGLFIIKNSDLIDAGEVAVSYRYFHLGHLETINGETDNPIFDGMRIIVRDTEYDLNEDSTRWSVGDCNYGLIAMSVSRFYPADFEIQFEGNLGDSVASDLNGKVVPFRIKNITHNDEPPFRISDFNQDGDWDRDESISIRPYGSIADGPLITIRFSQDSLAITDSTILIDVETDSGMITMDTTVFDTVIVEVIDPKPGDIFHIEIDRPFSVNDVFSFTTTASSINTYMDENELEKIAVVPNPYIVAASWEQRHQYESGRGPRKIDFINLPSKCTIKIFTLSGYLVNTLHHDVGTGFENGTESWNMLSSDNLDISYGIYLYHIDAPGVGEHTGKFAVIK